MIELLVVLVLLGTLGAIVAAGGSSEVGSRQRTAESIDQLRRVAVRTGRPQTGHFGAAPGRLTTVTAYPTGLVRVDSGGALGAREAQGALNAFP